MVLKALLLATSLQSWSLCIPEENVEIIDVINTTQVLAWEILWFIEYTSDGIPYTTKIFWWGFPENELSDCWEYPEDLTCNVVSSTILRDILDTWSYTEVWCQTWQGWL